MNKVIEINIIAEKENDQPDESVEFSNRILNLFKEKCKAHNSSSQRKVNYNQLINIYCEAVESYNDSMGLENKNRWCLAKVYAHLNHLKGEKIKYKKEILSTNSEFSIICDPSEKDYLEADKDINDYNLNYKFSSAQELYIKPDEQKYWFDL
ncbi:MAG: hypothetical protein FJ167_14575 [Gammaproteobacteria bacterium]|nr:hypothetical protein [Gammaproteobacteria bacterium]